MMKKYLIIELSIQSLEMDNENINNEMLKTRLEYKISVGMMINDK